MTTPDTVYYLDENIQITGRDLWIGTTRHRIEFVKSVKIETLPVRQSPLSDRMGQALAILFLTLVVAWLLNFLGQLAGFGLPQDLLRTIGVPLLLLLLMASLVKAVIDLREGREVAQIPVLRFRRSYRLRSDLTLASMDRAYLRRLVAIMNQVLHSNPPAPPAAPPPVVQVQDGAVTVGDQVYSLSDVQTVAYNTGMSKVTSWWLAFTDVGIPALFLSLLLESDPAIRPIAGSIRSFIFVVYLVVRLLTGEDVRAYAVYLSGSFGTAYIFATTDRSRATALIKTIKAQLPNNPSGHKPSRFQRRTT